MKNFKVVGEPGKWKFVLQNNVPIAVPAPSGVPSDDDEYLNLTSVTIFNFGYPATKNAYNRNAGILEIYHPNS